jgi:undecaprenyl-diphosphatase
MTQRTSRELLIAAAVLGAAFVALTLYVRSHGPIPGDGRALHYALTRELPAQAILDTEQFFGVLGSPAIGGLTTIIAAIITWRTLGAGLAALVLVAAAIVVLEKPIADLIGTTDASLELAFPPGGYPSGHALYAAAVGGVLVVIGRPEVRVIAGISLIAIGITRVTTHAHLVNEVLGGYLLGGAWLCLVLAVSRRVL